MLPAPAVHGSRYVRQAPFPSTYGGHENRIAVLAHSGREFPLINAITSRQA
jgi:hypothetical protein